MSNKALLELAQTQPRNKKELARVPGVSKRQAERHGRELLETIQRGAKSQPTYPPPQPRPDDQFLERVDRLRNWRKNTARKLGVGSDVVLPRDLLDALAEHNPQDQAELEGVLESVPWRIENFGDQILYTLQKG
jgi:ribonuclease D